MVEGLELVFHLITKFEVVEHLYLGRSSSLHTQLDESIVTVYSAILEYLIEVSVNVLVILGVLRTDSEPY